MKLLRFPVPLLVPTQTTVKYSNLKEICSNFDPPTFEPVNTRVYRKKVILLHGHHRASFLFLCSQAHNLESLVPARVFPNRGDLTFNYCPLDSLEDIRVRDDSWNDEIPLRDLIIRGTDVYAKFSGTSELLFSLPSKTDLQRMSSAYAHYPLAA